MEKDKDKKLYRVSNKLGTFYIVATSFDEAAGALLRRLDDADYGFSSYRKVNGIECIATESFFERDAKQFFSQEEGNLIIV